MRALLLNPYIYDFTAYDLWLRPLGLYYIAAVLRTYTDLELYWLDSLDRFQSGMDVKSSVDGRGKYPRLIMAKPEIYEKIPRNYSRYGLPLDSFMEKLNRIPSVDIVLVTSLMTYWVDGLHASLKEVRNRFPKAKIVLGGVLPTLLGDSISGLFGADYYVKGYGEEPILSVVEENGGHLKKKLDFSNLDSLPFPAYEYAANPNFLPLLTSRGCPYCCYYCASPYLNPFFLERSADSVISELHFMVSRYDTRHFIIFDDALLIKQHERFLKIFSNTGRIGPVFFHTPNGLHAGEIDDETASVLYKSNFRTIRLSFESTSEKILKESSGKVNTAQMEQAVSSLTKSGFKRGDIEVYLFFGYPGQTVKEVEEALTFVSDLGVLPRLSVFSPVPGTPLFKALQREGILSDPVDLYETNKIFFLYARSGLSHEEIGHIKKTASLIVRKNSASHENR